MTARLAALPVALLVVLAGCAGAPSSPSPAGTESPAETEPPTDSPTSTPDVAFPPNVTADGVTDAQGAWRTHLDALAGTDHRYTLTREVNRTTGGRHLPLNQTYHAGTVDGERVVYMEKRGTEPLAPLDVYVRGDTFYRQYLGDQMGYRYEVGQVGGVSVPQFGLDSGPSAVFRFALDAGDWNYAGTTVRNGTTLLRYEAGAGDDAVRDFEGTFLVSEAGVVHSLEASYVAGDREPFRATVDYELDRSVGPPAEPAWVDDLPRLALEANDAHTVFALRNDGGGPVPAGASVDAFVNGEDVRIEDANLSLPARLAPGDAVYLYAVETGDGPELRISAERPARDDLLDLSRGSVGVWGVGDVQVLLDAPAATNGTDG